ncbi:MULTISPECIES: hypothetical protein [unclassified Paracoccus (in: a-proteobacteria)]|uniref:hypothetical protein n=1 Tax=unclassified Paracoccus (in: a-proteobacteria) TaxID=2688777 RepID=UPI001F354ACF|nr:MULTISPECIES: hypothetical protein [unclassified Paracoccus (in: a-proteobacteria)]
MSRSERVLGNSPAPRRQDKLQPRMIAACVSLLAGALADRRPRRRAFGIAAASFPAVTFRRSGMVLENAAPMLPERA